ncbi:MAG: hypothetical protein LBR74_03530 [Eubacterium sp.]|jgi:Na+-translocating ferredoxin:NAD+ oxidoreductase RnfA subunit|nr:hypothetical protein [Eubacterium sp.]
MIAVFAEMLAVSFIAVFLQNSIFERALGVNIILYAARKKESVVSFSIIIAYVLAVSSALNYFVNKYFGHIEYYRILMPFFYILIISVVYVISLILIWAVLPRLFKKIKGYVHLSVFNVSVIGALFLESNFETSLTTYLGFGLGTGIGFLLACYLLYIAHGRLNSELVPEAFRGIPIMLVYIGIISLSLYAFIGYSTTL